MKNLKYILILFFSICLWIPNVNATKTIKEGTYIIKSSLDQNKVIDVSGALTANGTNIQIYQSNFTNAQIWNITYKNNYYTIQSALNNNKVIDIKGNIKKNKSNIQLYDNNNTDAQKWIINHIGKSLFEIKSTDGKYCIDLSGAQTFNKNNIQLYECNNTKAQQFKFVEILEGEKSVEDGTYIISSALDNTKVIDVAGAQTANGTNVQLYTSNNTNAQKWDIKYLNNGYYSITSKLNKNKCLDVIGANFTSGTNVQIYNCNNTDAQKWIIKDLKDGYYQILTKTDPTPLDVLAGSTKNGANIQIYYNNSTNAQKFKLTPVNKTTLENGTYTIKSKLDNTKAITIEKEKSIELTNIELNEFNNKNSQIWYITRLENGYYTIKSGLNSNLYLSINNNNVITKTTITEWNLQYINENEFYIINKENGLYLNLNNSKTENGTNINILTSNQSDAQKFYIEKNNINENDRTFSDGYYTINSKLNTNKVIDVLSASKENETNIQLYTSNNTNAQIWYFKYLDNGYYSINSALNPNTVIDLYNGKTTNGTNIQLYKSNNTDAQIWKLKDDGNGNISIISKKANICITIKNSDTANGTNVETNTCTYENNQKFILNTYTEKLIYTGIDISQYQKDIDWKKVSDSDIGFVMIRLGIGDNWTSQDDKKFLTNVAGCEKYNIPYGVYIYSYAKNIEGDTSLNANSESATSEAAHVLRLLNQVSYKPNLKTSVYIDMEEPSLEYLGKDKLTSIADKFCSIIEENNYNCGIYANKSWLTTYLDTKSLNKKYDIWLAEWIKESTYQDALSTTPSYNITNYKLWQFTSSGTINGISSNVDLDIGYNIFD